MIDSIHQSMLNTLLRCGEQFRRRYIEGEIIPPGIAAGRGTGVHKANEVNLKQKLITKEDMSLSDLQDITRDGYVHAFSNGVFIPKIQLPEKKKLLNDGLNDAIKCTKVYRNDVAPSLNPVSVEEEFSINVGLELPIAGRMDYQDVPEIGDLKTTTKKWPQIRITQEIQPVFYSYAHEQERGVRPDFIYNILIARKYDEEHQKLTMKATDADYKALFAKLKVFIKVIKTGAFLPANATDWICSEKWCRYYPTCKFV